MSTTCIFLKKLIGYSCNLLLLVCAVQCRQKEVNIYSTFPGKPQTPASIKTEHEYLLDKINKAALFKDSTGRTAIKLRELIQHHFREEEDYVLPPLGILPVLASGKIPDQGKNIIGLTKKLKSQLPHMFAEHQLIMAFMDEVVKAAALDNHPEIMELKKELQKHATIEEEILFPTAILIGEYLEFKLPA